MTNEHYGDRAGDPVEEIKARIRWNNEMLKQLQFKPSARRRPNTDLRSPAARKAYRG